MRSLWQGSKTPVMVMVVACCLAIFVSLNAQGPSSNDQAEQQNAKPSAAPTKPENEKPKSSYISVNEEDFQTVFARMSAEKPAIMKRQMALLSERYDLSDRPAATTMSRGKHIQEGVRVKLPSGMTWEKLADMTPDQIKA